MKSIENAIDLGLGLLILVLVANTAFYGLKLYLARDLNAELSDKNTVNTIVRTPVTDDLSYLDLDSMELAVFAASRNKDNVREIHIIVRGRNDVSDPATDVTCGAVHSLADIRSYTNSALYNYIHKGTGKHVASAELQNWTLITTEEQGRITMHILLN